MIKKKINKPKPVANKDLKEESVSGDEKSSV
jgi:hypothetical protein